MPLHAQYDAVAKEPLPSRWVDLIKHLNEKEGEGQERERQARRQRSRLS
jgi:hypothetical protein